jgi:hypothetical protein
MGSVRMADKVLCACCSRSVNKKGYNTIDVAEWILVTIYSIGYGTMFEMKGM